MVKRSIASALVPFALACAAAQTREPVDPGLQRKNAPALEERGEPFVAPPGPLSNRPAEVRVHSSDPRILISERPELYATALMILPATRQRVEVLTVLEAWLADEAVLGQAPIGRLPCASGAACVALASRDPERLLERVRGGISPDGLARAADRARQRMSEELSTPDQLAMLVLSTAPSFDLPGPQFLQAMGTAQLGETVQEVLDHSTICLIVPRGASQLGPPWAGPMPREKAKLAENVEDLKGPTVILVERPGEGPPLLAWALRGTAPDTSPEQEARAAEIMLARLEGARGAERWRRFELLAGASRPVDTDGLVESITQLGDAAEFLRRRSASDTPARELDTASYAVASRRLDFGLCERSRSTGFEGDLRTDIVVVGPGSLANALKAVGVAVRTIPPPR